MSKRLTGSVGTGNKILKNQDLYSYYYKGSEKLSDGTMYKFEWMFGNQLGYVNIIVDSDGKIDSSSLIDCTQGKREFLRPLGAYNDSSLYKVFEMMLENSEINYNK